MRKNSNSLVDEMRKRRKKEEDLEDVVHKELKEDVVNRERREKWDRYVISSLVLVILYNFVL